MWTFCAIDMIDVISKSKFMTMQAHSFHLPLLELSQLWEGVAVKVVSEAAIWASCSMCSGATHDDDFLCGAHQEIENYDIFVTSYEWVWIQLVSEYDTCVQSFRMTVQLYHHFQLSRYCIIFPPSISHLSFFSLLYVSSSKYISISRWNVDFLQNTKK